MPLVLLALAFAAAGPSQGEAFDAIWDDIGLNALIGNGNRLVSWDWAFGVDEAHPVELRIVDLACKTRWGLATCRFGLSRKRDPASLMPDLEPEPPLLRCRATLRRWKESDGALHWGVIHHRPGPEGGHSETSMRCRVGKAAAGRDEGHHE